MANRPAPALGLREGDREELVRLTRSPSVRSGLAQRSRILLLAADGESNTSIAEKVGVSRVTVVGWRSRYRDKGLPGLDDDPRSGRPRTVEHREVVAATLAPPPRKYGVTHWSSRFWPGIWGSGTRPWPGPGASMALRRGGSRRSSSPPTPSWLPRSSTWSGCTWHRRRTRSCCAWTRNLRSRRWTGPRRCCPCNPVWQRGAPTTTS